MALSPIDSASLHFRVAQSRQTADRAARREQAGKAPAEQVRPDQLRTTAALDAAQGAPTGFNQALADALSKGRGGALALLGNRQLSPELGELDLVNQVLGMELGGEGEGEDDTSLFEGILSGGMTGLNLKALNALALAQRKAGAGFEVRGAVNPTALPLDAIAPGLSAASAGPGLAAEVRGVIDTTLLKVPMSVAKAVTGPKAVAAYRNLLQPLAAPTAAPAAEKAEASKAPQVPKVPAARAAAAPEAAPATQTQPVRTARATHRAVPAPRLPVHGVLSSRFESGSHGVAAVGYDRRGGTSYGKYQISSRKGSMRHFLNFMDSYAPDWADRLREAGPLNAKSRSGAVPTEWKKIAAEDPKRFEALQDAFVHRTNYRPALQHILEETSINVGNHSPALQEVLWSTAVQHGARGAAEIFANATKQVQASDHDFERELIKAVYDERGEWFSRSSRQVRNAVRTRLSQEKSLALTLLSKLGLSKVI